MIKDDTRQTIKFCAWLIVFLVLAYVVAVLIFYKAGQPEANNNHATAQIALKKTPIKEVHDYYHLDRGVNSYAVKGIGKKHQTYYFVYLPGSKKGYLLAATEGVSETKIKRAYQAKKTANQITQINLGWYKNRAVWEVTAKSKTGSYRYQLYEFKNGSLIS
ncbi:hypothetical protein [Lactobacillus sp. ESL0681]|uniref:hypothetical protein n=1 Tax=Lactobacillus sp. ESL0681 TaxID=2983211 RepID=UPI0023F999D5|nr:hypothetical protein [Lactobacillus sp. ESL0681]WEV40688.1 hypothetical protein OZX59_01890 [Lactobacillus sp. ESL0681]